MNLRTPLLVVLLGISTMACTIHRIDVQQGNVLAPEMVEQLERAVLQPPVSKKQVRFILGTPMLQDPFHADRWDYIFTMQPGDKRSINEYKRVSVFFEGDVVKRIEKKNVN